jgi:hypothetical protein
MELAGLEPATSWVRFAVAAVRPEASIFGQFGSISAEIGPKNGVFGPISLTGRRSVRRTLIGGPGSSLRLYAHPHLGARAFLKEQDQELRAIG